MDFHSSTVFGGLRAEKSLYKHPIHTHRSNRAVILVPNRKW